MKVAQDRLIIEKHGNKTSVKTWYISKIYYIYIYICQNISSDISSWGWDLGFFKIILSVIWTYFIGKIS